MTNNGDQQSVLIISGRNMPVQVMTYEHFKTRIVHTYHAIKEELTLNPTYDAVIFDQPDISEELIFFVKQSASIWPWLPFLLVNHSDCTRDYTELEQYIETVDFSKNPQLFEAEIKLQISDRQRRSNVLSQSFFYFFTDFVSLCSKRLQADSLWDGAKKLGYDLTNAFDGITFGYLDLQNKAKLDITGAPISETEQSKFAERIAFRQKIIGNDPAFNENTISITGSACSELNRDSFTEKNFLTLPVIEGHILMGTFCIYLHEEHYSQHTTNIPLLSQQLAKTLQLISHFNDRGSHDSLTGLYNHGYLMRSLSKLWSDYTKHSHPLGMVMLDIDHFKNFNDSYGHQMGDLLICELSRLIKSVVKRSDIIARCGGDEIMIALPETGTTGSRAIAERLLEIVRAFEFKAAGRPLRFTISLGVATTELSDITSTSHLIELADKAMYLAKRSGRNQFCDTNDLIQKKEASGSEEIYSEYNSRMLSNYQNNNIGKGRLLVVDDDLPIVKLLDKILETAGYNVDNCTSSQDALEIIRSAPDTYDVIITDINMPGLDGIELLRCIQDFDPNIVSIIITGFASSQNTIRALRAGAYNLIQKPFDIDEVSIIVERAVERRRLKRQLDAYHISLEEVLNDKSTALNEALDDLKGAYFKTMEAIIRILDAHENEMANHSQRVSMFSVFLAEEMGITDTETLRTIKYGALLHDIGKIGISDTILLKPGPLNDEEWEIMKTHAQIGFDIVRTIPTMEAAADMVYSHHEKFAGSGYPRALKGEEIPLPARIFAVIDAYDALRSNRCYQKAQSLESIVNEVNRCSGTHFDPQIVNAFNNCYKRLDELPVELEAFWNKI